MDGLITVDVHYRGCFSIDPLEYIDPTIITVTDVNFGLMEYNAFLDFLRKLLLEFCEHVYFCIPRQNLASGLRRIQYDVDYQQFLRHAYLVGRISLYVDIIGQDLSGYMMDDEQIQDSSDDALSDGISVDHEEEDDDIIKIKSLSDDHFCTEFVVDQESGEQDATNEVGEDNVYPTHNPCAPWRSMKPILGMKFKDPTELKECLTNYAVAHGYGLWYEKTDSKRLLVRCGRRASKVECPFRLWATWMGSEHSFQIKSLHEHHNCARNLHLGSLVTHNWIANKYSKMLLEKPNLSYRDLQKDIKERYNLKVSVSQCQRAKKTAIGEVEGKLKDHYAMLSSYGEEIRRSNPGSTVKLDVVTMPDGTNYFSRFYICFKALKQGWVEACRPVIGVDGAFLKGICTGEIISAVGRDGNNQLFPIAWAVVSVENKDSWKWFLELLVDDIGFTKGSGLTILSDGHKGLLEAVKVILPNAEHRQCGRHIFANFYRRFKGGNFKSLFWKAAKATTPAHFEIFMNQIKDVSTLAHTYLMDRDPKCWSRAFFEVGRNCDAVENGVCESFNGAIQFSRLKPIISMLEEIRIYIMERITRKNVKAMKWVGGICPKIMLEIDDLKKRQRFWDVSPSGYHKFETRNGQEAFGVDLNERTCSCRSWQLTGIPCVHGMAALAYLNKDIEPYVASCFTKDVYLNSYRYNINPMNGKEMWPQTSYIPPLPPKHRRMPGRPTTKRKRGVSELEEQSSRHTVSRRGTIITCSICKARGHNKAKCPNKKQEDKNTSGSNRKTKNEDAGEGTSKMKPKRNTKKESGGHTVVPESEGGVNLGEDLADPSLLLDLEDVMFAKWEVGVDLGEYNIY